MKADVSAQSNWTEVRLEGRFDHAVAREFRQAIVDALRQDAAEVRIGFAQVDYIDSSALGMLLMAKEMAGKVGKTIVLSNAKGSVAKVLDFAKFKSVFKII
jgi:HptB-dependent secretion and biofilm anti anti-sigma factor